MTRPGAPGPAHPLGTESRKNKRWTCRTGWHRWVVWETHVFGLGDGFVARRCIDCRKIYPRITR